MIDLLFDFDGTIADTSKDMIKSLNILFNKEGFSAIDEDFGKNFISKGAMALIENSLKGYEIDADRKKNLLGRWGFREYSYYDKNDKNDISFFPTNTKREKN